MSPGKRAVDSIFKRLTNKIKDIPLSFSPYRSNSPPPKEPMKHTCEEDNKYCLFFHLPVFSKYWSPTDTWSSVLVVFLVLEIVISGIYCSGIYSVGEDQINDVCNSVIPASIVPEFKDGNSKYTAVRVGRFDLNNQSCDVEEIRKLTEIKDQIYWNQAAKRCVFNIETKVLETKTTCK